MALNRWIKKWRAHCAIHCGECTTRPPTVNFIFHTIFIYRVSSHFDASISNTFWCEGAWVSPINLPQDSSVISTFAIVPNDEVESHDANSHKSASFVYAIKTKELARHCSAISSNPTDNTFSEVAFEEHTAMVEWILNFFFLYCCC